MFSLSYIEAKVRFNTTSKVPRNLYLYPSKSKRNEIPDRHTVKHMISMKRLLQTLILACSIVFTVSANDRPSIVKKNAKGQEKTSFELLAEIKGIVDTLEEKDSLLRFSYMDYCLDSILFQSKEKYKRLYFAQQMYSTPHFLTTG